MAKLPVQTISNQSFAEACRVNHSAPGKPVQHCMAIGKNKRCPQIKGWHRPNYTSPVKSSDLSDCNNWRSITLFSVTGKVFASIVLSRLRDGVEMHLRTEQAGFRPGRSCNDQIFTLRQIIAKVTAWQKPVMINFIDFRKAFDCLHRPSMWSILRDTMDYGIPDTIVTIVQNLYKGSRSCVKLNGVCSDWFEVVTGVRQAMSSA